MPTKTDLPFYYQLNHVKLSRFTPMMDPLRSWAGAQPRRLQAGFSDVLQQMPSFVDPTCPLHSCHGMRGWADLLSRTESGESGTCKEKPR